MPTQEETFQAVENCLSRIGQTARARFEKFVTETYTAGGYRSGKWTYNVAGNKVSLEYWFSAFSNRKEETVVTFGADADEAKLENDLRECFTRLRQFVNRKKGMF